MISLLYAGNAGVFDGLLISALSTVQHTKEACTVYLLTMELTEQDPAFLPLTERHRAFLEQIYTAANPQSRVCLIDVGHYYRDTMLHSPNAQTGYTPYCFLRLFADRLPEIPDKILYLDTDTLINGDLAPLYHTDITGYELAAVLDYYGKWFMGYHYINSGVMLLNMPEIRKTGLFQKTIARCAEKRIFLPDQTALNRLVKHKYLLPGKYNEQKHFPEDTVIQHFTKTILWFPFFHTRNIKPWQTEQVKTVLTDKYNDILQQYLLQKQTFESEVPTDEKAKQHPDLLLV